MSNGKKIAAILKVFHDEGIEIECHAEHDILMFCEDNENIYFNEVLMEAGAFFSEEYGLWAVYCSA
jgi:hypothetical protein